MQGIITEQYDEVMAARRKVDPIEERLLAWMVRRLGIEPESNTGLNTHYWRFEYGEHEVELAVLGPHRNTCLELAPENDWIIRVEEHEPQIFVPLLEQMFRPMNRIKRKMSDNGKTRIQFKSGELLPDSVLMQ